MSSCSSYFEAPAIGISTNTLVHECSPKQDQAGTTQRECGKNQQDSGKIVAEVTTPLSVKQIKQILEDADVNYSGCTEKHELEGLLAKLRANPGMGCAQASGDGRKSSDQVKVIVCDMSM